MFSDLAWWPDEICPKFADVYGIDDIDSEEDWKREILFGMAELLNNMSEADDPKEVLQEINRNLWLNSMEKRMAIFTEYLGLDDTVESTTNESCDHLMHLASEEQLILLHQWIFSQGGSPEEPPVPLGELLQRNFIFMSDYGHEPEKFLLDTMALLSPGYKAPPLPIVQQ